MVLQKVYLHLTNVPLYLGESGKERNAQKHIIILFPTLENKHFPILSFLKILFALSFFEETTENILVALLLINYVFSHVK